MSDALETGTDALTQAAMRAWDDPTWTMPVVAPASGLDKQWLDPVDADRLYNANEVAAQWFESNFEGSWAQPYLAERLHMDLTGDRGARPGYAPPGWRGLMEHLNSHGIDEATAQRAGLGFTSSRGRVVDLMRDRLVFPIHDDTGRIAGFVGRENPADPGSAKYLNTRRTELFHKDELVFSTLPVRGRVAIVEGPADAVAVTVATGGDVVGVGTLGSKLSPQQTARLASLGTDPVLWRDGDETGRESAIADFRVLVEAGVEPMLVSSPEGSDPAQILTDGGPDAIRESLAAARPAGDVLVVELAAAGDVAGALELAALRHPTSWGPDAARIAAVTGQDPHEVRDALAVVVETGDPANGHAPPLDETRSEQDTATEVAGPATGPDSADPQVSIPADARAAVAAAAIGGPSVEERVRAGVELGEVMQRSPSVAGHSSRQAAVSSDYGRGL